MLKPILVEISLQNRGEVITNRRVRLDEADAHRAYDSLEALLLTEAESGDWHVKLWPTINRRRYELISKSMLKDITTEESAELEILQAYTDAHMARFHVPQIEALKAQLVKTGLREPVSLTDALCDATANEAEQVEIVGPTADAIRNVNAILQRRRTINAEHQRQANSPLVAALKLARAYLVGGPAPELGIVLDTVTEALTEADPDTCAHCDRPLAVCQAEQADISDHNHEDV